MAIPTLKSNAEYQKVCKKNNLSWLFDADRKIRPSRSLFGITRWSLVKANSDPRTDFSIRTSHSWKILIFLHTRPEFPWNRPGLGNVVLHGDVRRHSCMTSGWQFWRFDRIFDVLKSCWRQGSAKRFNVNVLDRNRSEHLVADIILNYWSANLLYYFVLYVFS